MFKWLFERLSEPSTYAGVAVLGATVSQSLEQSNGDTGLLISGVLGGIAALLSEKGNKKVSNF